MKVGKAGLRFWVLLVGGSALACSPIPAAAQATPSASRLNSEFPGQLFVRDQCIFSQIAGSVQEPVARQEALPGILATLAAGLVGDLAKGALTGISNAIKKASQEHAYTATGSDGFLAGAIVRSGTDEAPTYRFDAEDKCLIFVLPAPTGQRGIASFDAFLGASAPRLGAETEAAYEVRLQNLRGDLDTVGVRAVAPAVYIEVAMVPRTEGTLLQPLAVWYGAPLGGAGTRSRPTELVVELATPSNASGSSTIGSLYAVARIALPERAPGNSPLRRDDLINHTAVLYYPNRPETGFVAEQIKALGVAEAAIVTAQVTAATAYRSVTSAIRTRDNPANSTARGANQIAVDNACDVANAAMAAVNREIDARTALREGVMPGNEENAGTPLARHSQCPGNAAALAQNPNPNQPVAAHIAPADTGFTGASNARVSFVVVKDANQFGLAVAEALGAQASAVETAVTTELTPQPDWAATNTTLVTSMTSVLEKQAAYSAAVAAGVPAGILTAHVALLNAKALANQAAAALGEPQPFPGLPAEVAALLAASQ